MKFILSENIKHTLIEKYFLNEKYILTEASAIDVVQKIIDEINGITPDVKSAVTNLKTKIEVSGVTKADINTLTRILEDINTIANRIKELNRLPNNDDEVKDELDRFCVKTNALIELFESESSKENKKDISKIKDIKSEIEKSVANAWNPGDREKAVDNFELLYTTVTNSINTAELKKSAGQITDEVANKFTEACDTCIEALDKLPDYLKADIAETYLENYKQLLYNETAHTGLWYTLNKIIKLNANLADKIDGPVIVNDFISLVAELVNTLNSIKDIRVAIANKAAGVENDWAELYSQAKTEADDAEFWKNYYTIEWGNLAKKAEDLGSSLVQELTKIGWDTATNPMLAFLQSSYGINLLKSDKINKETWSAIHNAVANSDLTLADFKHVGTFKDDNIIFNEKLFDNANLIRDRLTLQKNTKELEYHAVKEAVQNLFKTNAGRVLNNVMYIEGDAENLNNDVGDKTFRSITQIRQILAAQLKTEGADSAKEPMTSAQIQAIIEKIGTKAFAKELLNYLWFYWHFTFKEALNDVDKNTGYKIKDGYEPVDPVRWDTCDKILELNKEYTKPLAKELLTELSKKAGYIS